VTVSPKARKVVGHALHPTTIVADAEVTLLEGTKPRVKLHRC
jgi:hypothetical protein